MSKNKRIWIIILVALALVLLIVLIWQFPKISDHVQQLDYGAASVQTATTQEAPSQELTQPRQTTCNASEYAATEPTESAEDATEEPTQITTQEQTPTHSTEQSTEAVTQPTQSQTQDDSQARIDELIAMVYALKNEYTARLQQIEQAGIDEYNALSENEKTAEKKKEIALRCVDEAYAMEKECDGRIDEICLELGILLVKTDGDMTLVNEIRYVYASEKAAAKNELTERYSALLG